MKPRKVLIAGITGYLGSQLAHRLVSEGGYDVCGLCRESSQRDRLSSIRPKVALFTIHTNNLGKLFRENHFDIIVNCVANYGRNTSSLAVLDANLRFPLELLELAVKHEVAMYLNAGTSLPAETNAYSLTKNQFSQWMRHHASQLVAIDGKIEHFYGPGEDEARFIRFLISKFLEPAATLDLTEGEQKRDFLYISDLVSGLRILLEQGVDWRPGYYDVPVGSGQAYLLRNVVETVRKLTDNNSAHINYGAVPYREHEVMESQADIRRLTELGWRPQVDLEAGLRQTIEYYRNGTTQRKIA